LKVCPSCGRLRELNEFSGFCLTCSRGTCTTCGRTFEPDHAYRKVCLYCRNEQWYEKYADQLESFLLIGLTLDKVKALISRDYAARCSCCGEVIKGRASNVTLFCTKYARCRTTKRRYRTLKKRYVGQSDVFPLIHVLLEVHFATRRTEESGIAA
jgi:hypothetical protein